MMSLAKAEGILYGLLIGSIIGALSAIYFPNKTDDLQLKGVVEASTGNTEITEINYKNGRCSVYKEDYRLIGMSGTSAKLGGSYACRDINSKDDILSLKKALDKTLELGWVK